MYNLRRNNEYGVEYELREDKKYPVEKEHENVFYGREFKILKLFNDINIIVLR